jgi:hypothetical protein
MFTDLPKRVAEIQNHHEYRKREMLDALTGRPRTAYELASVISWSTGGVPWEQLSPFLRHMAVTETLAHLEMSFAQGDLTKTLEEGRVYYTLSSETN